MAAVAAVPADAGALGFHPSSDTRAELVNCSIKQAKPDTFHFTLSTSTSLFHLPEWHTCLLLFMQSLAIHRHEEVIQRLSQRGMCKDAVANNGIGQLPHHGDLQYRHHFAAFHAKDRAT